jgi:glycosyltransferase involved in cell wall biosynthesis
MGGDTGGQTPKRIVLASTAIIKGGVWRHIEDLGRGLQREGLDVTLGLLPAAVALHESAEQAGLPWEPLQRTLRPSFDLWHVHLHDTYDRRAIASLASRRLVGRSVITEHLPRNDASDDRLEPQHRRTRYAAEGKTLFKRVEFRLASAVIAVSTSSARFLEERYLLPARSVTTVHNGISAPAQVAEAAPRDRPLRVVTVGSLGRQKGHDVLLEAARVATEEWEITVVGDGPQLAKLRGLASGLKAGRVRFTGWVDDPRAEVAAADVACMPSRWESFPYAALEAAALARAVVGSRVDGLDEIIIDGATGILVEPDRPAELAAALDRLAANPQLVAAYGRAAHDRVRARFGLQQMIDGVLATYARAS